ncbi:MAG: 16S rRNA (uracil(1498)-N(3))-methyltransferase [Bacteroidia bacterium]|nr:16S rRNA (uracil(1498)-N(3))-methyltransferase [Bacteroidia bacterium]
MFYTPDINSIHYTLSEEESKHCVRALRLKKGDPISLIDGRGNLFEAVIADDNPKKCAVLVNNIVKEFGKRNYYLHIAMAPTKNIERFEWFLEKATEIGIDEITPLLCEHSERKTMNRERLFKVITSAVKQSITAYHPVLHEMIHFEKFIKETIPIDRDRSDNSCIAHCRDGEKQLLKDIYKKGEKILILIGPEGDFSEKEINLARQNNYKEISLGNYRLRTETAGIAGCHAVSMLNQED